MQVHKDRPLVVQSDFTILLEAKHSMFEEVRAGLAKFADLIKTPAQLHTYRMTSLSLWNAAASGLSADEVIQFLEKHAKFGLPASVRSDLKQFMDRYGMVKLERSGEDLLLVSDDIDTIKNMVKYKSLQSYGLTQVDDRSLKFAAAYRGVIKQELMKLGFPVEDTAGYNAGEELAISLKQTAGDDGAFRLRDYQLSAVESFYQGGSSRGGSGVIVLPCGAGKTVVGIAAMGKLSRATLILTTNTTSVKQWKREILHKTELSEDMVGEYTGACKEVKPVTIATYQILTHRKGKDTPYEHMELFRKRDWGLIVYDEVHLLPAPVFRMTAELQAARRLGLTATLVREDGHEEDVFSLVGPKRFELAWKDLERGGWIASAECIEVRVPLPDIEKEAYMQADARQKMRIASENSAKLDAAEALINKHADKPALIIGQYLEQLRKLSERIGAHIISGETPMPRREELFQRFREGKERVLIVSKVANFAVDLPDAAAAIQVSGSFGSRQEEAQRLGRILRPKDGANNAVFYSLVSEETKEQEYAWNRQLFLLEQGYQYRIERWNSDQKELLVL